MGPTLPVRMACCRFSLSHMPLPLWPSLDRQVCLMMLSQPPLVQSDRADRNPVPWDMMVTPLQVDCHSVPLGLSPG